MLRVYRSRMMHYDILVFADGGDWYWGVIAVGPDGRDRDHVAAGGPAPTEDAAYAAAQAAVPRE